MSDSTIAILIIAACGPLFILISIPLIRRRVPPNMWYGCRTQKTLSDPKLWYEVNFQAGKNLLVAGIVTFLTSLICAVVLPESLHDAALIAALAIFLVSIGIALFSPVKRSI